MGRLWDDDDEKQGERHGTAMQEKSRRFMEFGMRLHTRGFQGDSTLNQENIDYRTQSGARGGWGGYFCGSSRGGVAGHDTNSGATGKILLVGLIQLP